MDSRRKHRVLDLFAGAGGLSLGFTQTGRFDIRVAVENNQDAQRTFQRNHAHAIVINDIRDICDYAKFSEQYGEFEVIIGGPPCQGFSNANRQRNHLICDNNMLIKKFVESILALKPKVFVLENVSTLLSEKHRFFKSHQDGTDDLGLRLREERLQLLPTQTDLECVRNLQDWRDEFINAILPSGLLKRTSLFLKNLQEPSKRLQYVSDHGATITRALLRLLPLRSGEPVEYYRFENHVFNEVIRYCASPQQECESLITLLKQLLGVQRLFDNLRQLMENRIVVECYEVYESGLFALVKSYSIADYLRRILEQDYVTVEGVVNSAWYGVPQLRERYIAIGVRKDPSLTKPPQLPPKKVEEFLTVRVAIADLEKVEPNFDTTAPPLILGECSTDSVLMSSLRDSGHLHNHVVTQSTPVALKRFATLGQGQNFHDLDLELIKNTYAKPERTQNTIYLRLTYEKPSGTVVNVRKSMWIHPIHNRAISIREAARLQSFPDSFVFEGSKNAQYQQVGNAVPPLLAQAIAEEVVRILEPESLG